MKLVTFKHLKKLINNKENIEVVVPLKKKPYIIIGGEKYEVIDATKVEVLNYFEE